MTRTTLQLETLTCPSCLQKIEGALKGADGVEKVKVLFNASRARVEHDEDIISKEEVKNLVEKVGYNVENVR